MKKIKIIVDAFTVVVTVAALVLLFALVGTRLFGVRAYAVLSGSMEPEYHIGSVVYVRSVAPEDIEAGDVVTYSLNKSTVTHRVVEVIPEKKQFITKGDANNLNDSPVSFSSVYGKVVYNVPYLGYIAVWSSTVAGKLIMIIGAVALILLITLFDLLVKKSA